MSIRIPFHRSKNDDGTFVRDAIVLEGEDVISFDLVTKDKNGTITAVVARVNIALGSKNGVSIDIIPLRASGHGLDYVTVMAWEKGPCVLRQKIARGLGLCAWIRQENDI